jgi:hypothetical protein
LASLFPERFLNLNQAESSRKDIMPRPTPHAKRTLVRELKKRRATPFQVTAATILLHAVGLPAALSFLKGPRRRFLRTACEVRRYLARHGISDRVHITRVGLPRWPLFVVHYADIDLVKAVRFVSVNGKVRLHSTRSHRFKVRQLAYVLSRTANVIAAGQIACCARRR